MISEHKNEKRIADRVLGEYWEDWDESKSIKPINESAFTFLKLSFVEVVFVNVLGALLVYLIYPRIAGFSVLFANFIMSISVLFLGIINIWFVLFFLSVLLNKNFFQTNRISRFFFRFIFNKVYNHHKLFKISLDRVGHSVVKINNEIMGTLPKRATEKLLLILPRCLTKENFKEVKELVADYDLEMITVGGGELARKKIAQFCPSSIIAIACERDLIAGMRDMKSHLFKKDFKAFGLTNSRPNGPCKNTVINVGRLKELIEKCVDKKDEAGSKRQEAGL